MIKSPTLQHYQAELAKSDDFKVCPTGTMSALEESVRLQSHYAALLNQYDGGNRKGFADAAEWVDQLHNSTRKETKHD